MTTSTTTLPHLSASLFLTDGGLETTLIFLEGFELPYFAAFDLLREEKAYNAIRRYYQKYLQIAKDLNTGFILESPTWRASPDWLEKLGYPQSALTTIHEAAVQLLVDLKNEWDSEARTIVISGCVGPRGDGYQPGNTMSAEEAQAYHSAQLNTLSNTAVDMASALTMTYTEEAIGIARAAAAVALPVVISFTVETDGHLPTGMSLKEAIEQVDASTKELPLYYMINCAHPMHFKDRLLAGQNEPWTRRIKGIRANASCKSHAELDEASTLDRGHPQDLGKEYKMLQRALPHLNVWGGCCGTDEEHIREMAKQLTVL